MINTMVCRQVIVEDSKKESTIGFTLIDDKYQLHYEEKRALARKIANKEIIITNLSVDAKGEITYTNGAKNRYTVVEAKSGKIIGSPKAVILSRIEKNEKLDGYMVFLPNGKVSKLSVAEASSLAVKGLISNGKIRHTDNGDTVSSISGNYPLMQTKIEEAPAGELTVEIVFFSAPIKEGKTIKYGGALITSTSALTMNKLIDKLAEDNKEIVSKYKKITGVQDTEGIIMARRNANSMYGVFSIETLKALKAKSVNKQDSKVLISVIDFDNNEEESIMSLRNGEITIAKDASERATKAAKKYAEEIRETFYK